MHQRCFKGVIDVSGVFSERPWGLSPVSDVPEMFEKSFSCTWSVCEVFRDVMLMLWLCYACVWCQRYLMYSCMLYQWCYTVNKCLNDRNGSTLSDLFTPCSFCPKLTWVKRTQLPRPSISGWYYPSVPGGSESQLHCVTLLVPNEGLKGNDLGSRGILADEPFYLITFDSWGTTNINHHLCKGDVNPHPQLKMSLLVW